MANISSEQIKGIREKLGLTQAQLGEKLSVSANTIARWERGELEPEHPGMLMLALQYLRSTHIRPEVSAELAARHLKLMKKMR